jgi:outer membrane lipoprotein-sorting protein
MAYKMKNLICIIFLLTLFSQPVIAAEGSVASLLKHIDDLYRGTSSHAEVTMRVKTEYFERELTMEAWSKGSEASLIKILAPKKERGITTLKAGKEIWNYLPKTNRVIKVPSSMMAANWMGSHFTNDDLVKESRYSDDYDCSEKSGTSTVITIECLPKEDAAVVWGRVDLDVAAQTKLPMEVRYYDEDFTLVRTMIFDEVNDLGGRKIPARLRMVPEDKPGEETVVTYKKIRFDLELEDNMFSIRSLKRKSRQ